MNDIPTRENVSRILDLLNFIDEQVLDKIVGAQDCHCRLESCLYCCASSAQRQIIKNDWRNLAPAKQMEE